MKELGAGVILTGLSNRDSFLHELARKSMELLARERYCPKFERRPTHVQN